LPRNSGPISGDVCAKFIGTKGTAEAIAAVLGGHADIGVGTMAAIIPFLKAGKARVLVINVPERVKAFPDIFPR
jgi:tripartite-type tricarboxylate transporter receptor subunit TctC